MVTYATRPYQEEANSTIVKYAEEHPTGRLLLVLPPGAGKTLVATQALLSLRGRYPQALVVGHRREMAWQHYRCLLDCGLPREEVGLHMSGNRLNASAPVQVVCLATLNRRGQGVSADLLVTDEAHRDASPTRRRLRRSHPRSFQLGLTATPYRLDGKNLMEDFDDMLVVSSISELIADGYVVAPKVYTVPSELLPELAVVKVVSGEYDGLSLERQVNQRLLVGGIVDHWLRRAQGRKTVCFATSIEHSRHITKRFTEAGVEAAHLDLGTSWVARGKLLARLADPEDTLRVISCVDVLAEGWDCPPCKCVIQARPTQSLTLHLQQSGRCTRPWGEMSPIILDHAGNTVTHGLPQTERVWSLDLGNRPSREGEAPCKVCGGCWSVVPAGVVKCPDCGWEFPQLSKVLEEYPGELGIAGLTGEALQQELAHIRGFAQKRGFSEDWVNRVLRAKFGATFELSIDEQLHAFLEGGHPFA